MFIIDQVGLPAGVVDTSRTDGLDTGAEVTITYVGRGTFRPRLLWTPFGEVGAVASLAETSPGVWKFTPTANRPGTYRIEGIENENKSNERRKVRLLRVRMANGVALPAYGERSSELANLDNATSTQVSESEDNSTDYQGLQNTRPWAGWLRSWDEAFRTLDGVVAGASRGVVGPVGARSLPVGSIGDTAASYLSLNAMAEVPVSRVASAQSEAAFEFPRPGRMTGARAWLAGSTTYPLAITVSLLVDGVSVGTLTILANAYSGTVTGISVAFAAGTRLIFEVRVPSAEYGVDEATNIWIKAVAMVEWTG